MNFDALKTELADRGFSDLSDTRRGVYINAARAELDRMYLWSWREKSVTGTAPVSITDLGTIEAVTNETLDYRLRAAQFSDLLDWYGDLSTTGSPTYYYRASPSGTPVIATYPTSSDTIGVQYWKQTVDLSAAGDTPASPSEAHLLIVELAIRRVAKDPDRRAMAQQEIDRQVPDLLDQFPPGVADDDGMIVRKTNWYE